MPIIRTEISNLENIFKIDSLQIPHYQRPYVWSKKSVIKLYSDILQAYHNKDIEEYRLGTIILHKDDNNDKYYLVDGQQRLITLSLLIYTLSNKELEVNLLKQEVNTLSNKAILENYNYIEEVVNDIDYKDNLLYFILNNCTLGVIITNKQEEAFQFFDSQNSRGKTLEPHDILKAYHLREMNQNNESNDTILYCVNKWENIEANKLAALFADYLFPIKLWSKENNKRNFTTDELHIYEGSSLGNKYNYQLYRMNNINNDQDIVFQINEEIFSGKYFFYYIFHYHELLNKIRTIVKERNDIIILNNQKYINTMFHCALIMYVDRFNLDELKTGIKEIYKWSYGLRLSKRRVDRQVVDKYVTGGYDKLGCGALLKMINEMYDPEEILKIETKIDYEKHKKFQDIRRLLDTNSLEQAHEQN